MLSLRVLLLIGLFGAAGAISRFALSELVYRSLGRGFPFGTLAVNGLGCFLIGGLAHIGFATDSVPEVWRVALTAGFLGGLTTFSTFGYETFRHLDQGEFAIAAGNVVGSVFLGLIAVWAGVAAAKSVLG